MALRGWLWREQKTAAGVENRAVTFVIRGTVTVLPSRTFWNVGGSVTAPVLVRLASEAVSAEDSFLPERATADG